MGVTALYGGLGNSEGGERETFQNFGLLWRSFTTNLNILGKKKTES
jgi:hypothetical protein